LKFYENSMSGGGLAKAAIALSLLAVGGCLYVILGDFSGSKPQTGLLPGQEEPLKALVLQTIKENPNVVVDVLGDGIAKKREETIMQLGNGLAQRKAEVSQLAITFGNKNAKNVVACFFDPLCPHCIEFLKNMQKVLDSGKDVCFWLLPVVIVGEDSILMARLFIRTYGKDPAKALRFLGSILDEKVVNQESIERALKKTGFDAEEMKSNATDSDKRLLAIGELANQLKVPVVPAAYYLKGDQGVPLVAASLESLMDAADGKIVVPPVVEGSAGNGPLPPPAPFPLPSPSAAPVSPSGSGGSSAANSKGGAVAVAPPKSSAPPPSSDRSSSGAGKSASPSSKKK
jgi:protein-disulfide isomerase